MHTFPFINRVIRQTRNGLVPLLHLFVAIALILPQLVGAYQTVQAMGGLDFSAESDAVPIATPNLEPSPTSAASIGSDDITPSPTPILFETVVPTETIVPQNTPTGLPFTTPTETATPTEGTSSTPTSTPSSTPTSTLVPTLPSPTVTPSIPLIFTLVTTPTELIPGYPFALSLIGKDFETIITNKDVLLTVKVPDGITPVTTEGVSFDQQNRKLTLAQPSTLRNVGWQIAPDAHGPYTFEVVLYKGNVAYPTTVTVPEYGVFEIAQNGGKAEGLNGMVSVTVPEGAVSEPMNLRIQPVPQGELPYSLSGHPFRLTAKGQNSGEEISKFTQSIQIAIPYNEDSLPGDESTLSLYFYDEQLGTWAYMPSWVDPDQNILYAYTNHFTDFDVDVKTWEAATLPTLDSFQVSQFTGAATYGMSLWVPPGPGGLQPSLNLSYNSQTVDDATARTQASWIGMGWSFNAGYISRIMNGTPDDPDDDLYSIVMNGIGGTLLLGTDGYYHTPDESFWRIQKNGDSWIVWDKNGTKYEFGLEANDKADYPMFGNVPCLPNINGNVQSGYSGQATWRWSLSKITNIYGKSLTYTYLEDTSNAIPDPCNDAAIQNGQNPFPNQHAEVASYPEYIYYPDFVAGTTSTYTYRIRLIPSSLGVRTDYDPGWISYGDKMFFEQRYLVAVQAERYSGGTWNIIHKYKFSYMGDTGAPTNYIFPGLTWPGTSGNRKTLTLYQIREYGDGGTTGLPPTTFAYADGMHLSSAENGYGGKVEFTYDVWYDTTGVQGSDDGAAKQDIDGVECVHGSNPDYNDNPGWEVISPNTRSYCRFNDAAIDYLNTGPATVEVKTDLAPGHIRPGQAYALSLASVSITQGGTFRFRLNDGTIIQDGTLFTNPSGVVTSVFLLPATASAAQVRIQCTPSGGNYRCDLEDEFKALSLVTRYRISTKTIYTYSGATSGLTYTYTYSGASTNIPTGETNGNSDDAATSNPFTEKYSEFRGHQQVTEISPSGLKTITQFYQDDNKKGQVSWVEVRDTDNTLLQKTINGYTFVDDIFTAVSYSGKDGVYTDLDIDWTYTANTQIWTCITSSNCAKKKVVYQYQTGDQGNQQYGNITRVFEQAWDGSSFVNYRVAQTLFYPYTSSSSYLVGLPGWKKTFECPLGVCDYDNSHLFTSVIYYYDDQTTNYNIPPTSGKLTDIRALVDKSVTPYQYSQVSYTYDAWGNQTTVKTWDSYTAYYADPSTGLRTTTNVYDGTYHTYLTEIRNPKYAAWGNKATVFTYDYDKAVVLSMTDPNLNVISATYDAFGRMLTIVKPGDTPSSPTVTFTYNDTGATSVWPFGTTATQKIISSTSLTVRKYYDGVGRLLQTQTAGAVLNDNACSSDSDTSEDTCDILVNIFYDSPGGWPRLQTVPYASPVSSGFVNRTAPNANQPYLSRPYIETQYDTMGRVTKVVGTDYTETNYAYDVDAAAQTTLTTVTDANENTTVTHTDVWGRTTEVHPPSDPWTSYTYDVANQLIQVDLMDYNEWYQASMVIPGFTTTLEYDQAGRKIYMDDMDMGHWEYIYDALGNLKTQTDVRGCITTFTYDTLSRLTNKTYSGTPTSCDSTPDVTYTYDSTSAGSGLGQRTGMSDGSGSSSWYFDTRGRQTQEAKVISGGGTFSSAWNYNSADMPASMTYPANNGGYTGETLTYAYLPQGTLANVATNYTIAKYVRNSIYDATGRITWRELGQNGSSPYLEQGYWYKPWTEPNGQGRLANLAVKKPDNTFLMSYGYGYDAVGNIITINDWIIGGPQAQTFSYDSLNRLTSAIATSGAYGNYPLEGYSYDDDITGNLITKAGLNYTYNNTHFNGPQAHTVRIVTGNSTTNKAIKIRAYSTVCNDGVGATMELWVNGTKKWTQTNVSTSWTEYQINNIPLTGSDVIEVVFTNDCNQNGHDRNLFIDYVIVDGQTIQAENGDAIIDKTSGGSAFDGRNIVPGQQNIAWNGALRFAIGSAMALGYDENGNMTSRVIAGNAYIFTYDAENRITDVSRDGVSIASFVYDGDGNRVKATVGGVTTSYVGNYFEWSGSTSTMVKYYYAGSQRIAMRTGSGTTNTNLKWLLGDHLGSTSITANYDGASPVTQLYKPWGEVRYQNGTLPTGYTYTGQYSHTDDFGLMFYNARWYDPVLGRFAQADPIMTRPFNPSAFDKYSYVENNPIKYNDPSGYCKMIEQKIGGGRGIELMPDLASDGDCWNQYYKLTEYMTGWGYDPSLYLGEGEDWIFIEDLELDPTKKIEDYEKFINANPSLKPLIPSFTVYYQAYIFHAIMTGNPNLAYEYTLMNIQATDPHSEVDDIWAIAQAYHEYSDCSYQCAFNPVPRNYYEWGALNYFYANEVEISMQLSTLSITAVGPGSDFRAPGTLPTIVNRHPGLWLKTLEKSFKQKPN